MLISHVQVAKEDIQVRFFEEKNGKVVWEGFGDFQPSQVHKQTAICFKAPRYHTLDITEPVKVFIQLRRPSDGATSEAHPFEFLPLDSGRPLYWSFRRNYAKKGNYNLFSTLLASDAKLSKQGQVEREKKSEEPTEKPMSVDTAETNNNDIYAENYSKVQKEPTKEKSFNELINQVAELDEIYSETQARLLNEALRDIGKPQYEESFDDGKTYSSLQLAFKNPIDIVDDEPEEIIEPQSPIVDVSVANVAPPSPILDAADRTIADGSPRNKRESPEKPPLPPKRTKKIETYIGNSVQDLNEKTPETPRVSVSRSHSFSMTRPKSEEFAPLTKLPPTPCSTLPNPKKKGLFSKLFGRKNKTPAASREASLSPSFRTENLGCSATNISTTSATSIRIPLKDSPTVSINDGNQDTVMQDLTLNLDLTEAEHYALYTAMAPHATQSEFDEMSCYYAPVEGGKILTNSEMLARLTSKTWSVFV
mgnify:CR=1 FL=1